MMDWTHWIAVERPDMGDGTLETSPIELQEDGSFTTVIGMCLITNLDGLKGMTSPQKVWKVDDIFEPTTAEVLWERDAT